MSEYSQMPPEGEGRTGEGATHTAEGSTHAEGAPLPAAAQPQSQQHPQQQQYQQPYPPQHAYASPYPQAYGQQPPPYGHYAQQAYYPQQGMPYDPSGQPPLMYGMPPQASTPLVAVVPVTYRRRVYACEYYKEWRYMCVLLMGLCLGLGIWMWIYGASSCPSGCSDNGCLGVDGDEYDCTCADEGICRNYASGPTLIPGIVLTIIGGALAGLAARAWCILPKTTRTKSCFGRS